MTTESSHTSPKLERSFLYQDQSTGKPSSTSLTLRQLVRILCPAVALPQHITPHTNLLEILPQEQKAAVAGTEGSVAYTYASAWQPARTIPILREAAASWYYCDDSNPGTVRGPVSCRQLLHLDPLQVRVYCADAMAVDATALEASPARPETEKEWKRLSEDPNLWLALECLRIPSALMMEPSSAPSDPSKAADTTVEQPTDDLETFLSSVAADHPHPRPEHGPDDDEEEEAYESDGGTRYVKDPRRNVWVHEALAPARPERTTATAAVHTQVPTTRKRSRRQFSARNARCWIYLSGLPSDATLAELEAFCSKAGILDLDPETQRPRIKLYKDKETGVGKGDASVCYARPESVELALVVLDEAPFRPLVARTNGRGTEKEYTVRVERAKFEMHGQEYKANAQPSQAKRKVARLATEQAVDWDEGVINGRLTGGRKGLRIIVLKNMFDPSQLDPALEDVYFSQLEQNIRTTCEGFGVVEKITVFSKNPAGVVIVKFAQPGAASDAIKHFDGQRQENVCHSVEATFWDGITDYTVKDEVQEEKESIQRQEEFGSWIESQELPPELRLQVEDPS